LVFGLKTNYFTLLDCRDWGGKAVILSKMTWESFKSQFMPLQGPCFSVIVIACISTSKYHINTPDPFDKDETPGNVPLSRLDMLSDQT
jgi:hypothetical protein